MIGLNGKCTCMKTAVKFLIQTYSYSRLEIPICPFPAELGSNPPSTPGDWISLHQQNEGDWFCSRLMVSHDQSQSQALRRCLSSVDPVWDQLNRNIMKSITHDIAAR